MKHLLEVSNRKINSPDRLRCFSKLNPSWFFCQKHHGKIRSKRNLDPRVSLLIKKRRNPGIEVGSKRREIIPQNNLFPMVVFCFGQQAKNKLESEVASKYMFKKSS